MDVLSDILEKVKLSSSVYFKSDFSSPWGMNIGNSPLAQFHIVTRGQCVLKVGGQITQLFAGDIIVFPLGTSHWLADQESSNRTNGKDVIESIISGESIFNGDSISTTLICGHFEFDREIEHPLLSSLPELIHITDSERKELPWLVGITDLIIKEAGKEASGSNIILNRLGEVLFIHTLRAYLIRESTEDGFLAAIHDERIGSALAAFHNYPENEWSLALLAQIAGMSRTSFCNTFKLLIGETPLNYITVWRIIKAKELLKQSKKTIGEIAEGVGYKSEASFSRIFKKRVSLSPLKYRHTTQEVS